MNNNSTKQSPLPDQEGVRRAVVPTNPNQEQRKDHSMSTPVPPPPKRDNSK